MGRDGVSGMFYHLLQESSSPPRQQHCSVPQKSAGWRSLKAGNEVNTCSLNTRAPLASKGAQAPNELTGPTELWLGVLADASGEGRDLEPWRGCPSRRTLLAASLGTAGIVEGQEDTRWFPPGTTLCGRRSSRGHSSCS